MVAPALEILGRSAVVGPGEEAPAGWEGCERVTVSAVTDGAAAEMQAAWRARRARVIELTPGIGLDDPVLAPPERLAGRQPWEWPVDLTLPGETLHHAVWANSVDARSAAPPARSPGGPVRWRWAEEAARLGCRPVGPEAGMPVGCDVLLPDGTPAVCDGGPIDAELRGRLGLAVVHRVSIEHGSTAPLGSAGPSESSATLAPDQMAAVHEPRAGARIIAPAGSGKTRVLTERARHMVSLWGLPPAALALVAYNVRAAAEMRERLADVPALRIRTLNALGLRLSGRSATIEEREVRSILSDLLPLPRRADTDPVAPWIEALSRVRLGLAHPEEVEEELADVSGLLPVAIDYRRRLEDSGRVDFDEQVVAALGRLLADPAFRARSQRYARVLLVDEFQDLTPAHLLLLRLLSGPAGSVFAVGDDDQTIYGYSGATPRWLVDFERWFPGSAAHALEVNYRCPPPIVAAAANLLTYNDVRVAKTIKAAPIAGAEPAAIAVDVPGGPDPARDGGAGVGPARRTTGRVVSLLDAGVDPADIAVLSRVNASLVPVQVLLHHGGIPVNARGERNFLGRSGVRAAMAWLRLAAAPAKHLPGPALEEAARRPKRGMSHGLIQLIGRSRGVDGLEGLVGWLDQKGSSRDADKVGQFSADLALVRRAAERADTAAIMSAIRHQVGLDGSAEALDSWSHGAIAAHLDDLEALTELASLEPDPDQFPVFLAEHLAAPADPAGVTLASVHSVKGREWPHVVVHHATDGLLPHRLAADLEEERRVFHVAITRASRSLAIVAGEPPSPFLAELAAPRVAGAAPLTRRPSGRPDRTHATHAAGTASGGAASARAPSAGAASAGPARGGAGWGRPATTVRRPTEHEMLLAAVGTTFRHRGHEYLVVDVGSDGALCQIVGGEVRTRVRFGTSVEGPEGSFALAHPDSPTALERLREWRREKAKATGKPAYVIFDDRTLREIAGRLPTTETGLLAITGIGPVKLDTYGADLVAIVESVLDRAGAVQDVES